MVCARLPIAPHVTTDSCGTELTSLMILAQGPKVHIVNFHVVKGVWLRGPPRALACILRGRATEEPYYCHVWTQRGWQKVSREPRLPMGFLLIITDPRLLLRLVSRTVCSLF